MAHQVYKINDKKVPSVTTIIGRFKNSTGLLIWSNQLGLEGKRYQDELNKASEIGTSVHELAELHIKDHFYTIPEDEIVKIVSISLLVGGKIVILRLIGQKNHLSVNNINMAGLLIY